MPRLSGFESDRGALIFSSPISHTLKGLCFDTSDSKRDFYLHWFFQPLCDGADSISLSYGARVLSPRGTLLWSADTPALSEAIVNATRGVIDYLYELESEHDVVHAIKRISSGSPTFYKHIHCAYLLILSKSYKAADDNLIELFSRESEVTRDWERRLFDTARSVHKMLRNEPSLALQRVQDWRASTLLSLRLLQWATG